MLDLLKRKILNQGAYCISYFRLQSILRSLPEDALIIDCGANKGDISLLFAKKKAKVFAFEPDPLAFSTLKERTSAFSNIDCRQEGVGAKEGKFKLHLHKSRAKQNHQAYSVSSSIVSEKNNIDQGNFIEVNIIDIDAFIHSLNKKVDLVKMDIEGAEIEVLEKFLENKTYEKIGLLLVETHEAKIPSHVEKVDWLKKEIAARGIDNIKLNWI